VFPEQARPEVAAKTMVLATTDLKDPRDFMSIVRPLLGQEFATDRRSFERSNRSFPERVRDQRTFRAERIGLGTRRKANGSQFR
jgi:hypothetical protein